MEQTPRHPRRTISIDGFLAPAQPLRPSSQPTPRQRPVSRPGLTRTAPTLAGTPMAERATRPSVIETSKPEVEHKKKRSFKSYTKRAALTFVALIVLSGGWMGFKVYRN